MEQEGIIKTGEQEKQEGIIKTGEQEEQEGIIKTGEQEEQEGIIKTGEQEKQERHCLLFLLFSCLKIYVYIRNFSPVLKYTYISGISLLSQIKIYLLSHLFEAAEA